MMTGTGADTGTGTGTGADLDPAALRATFGHYGSGVTVVTALDADGPVGMTVQAFHGLSLDPPLVLLCPAHASTTWPRVARGGRLCVNVLAEDQAGLARTFARSQVDRFAGVRWSPDPGLGQPVLDGGLAWFACVVERTWSEGDHHVVIARVRGMEVAREPRQPLLFYRSALRALRPDRPLEPGDHDPKEAS